MSEAEENEALCLELDCETSGRTALVSDEGDSVWLYLTHPSKPEFDRDCWLFNKPTAAAEPDLRAYEAENRPPPAPAELILPGGVRACPHESAFSVRWSKDGESAVIALDGLQLGVVSMTIERGMSRYLASASGWGQPWDEGVLARLF